MNSIFNPRAYMRSMATRESNQSLSGHVKEAINVCKDAGFDLIILESAGVGQSDASILEFCTFSLYVMTPEYGAASQLEKINMIDYADVIAINKFDKAGALDAYNDVCKQYKRSHKLFEKANEELPILGTIASQFNDPGVNTLFNQLMKILEIKSGKEWSVQNMGEQSSVSKAAIIPPYRVRYLAEIAETNKQYDSWAKEQSILASNWYKLKGTEGLLGSNESVSNALSEVEKSLDPLCKDLVVNWKTLQESYKADTLDFQVRDKVIKLPLTFESLSKTKISKVYLPKYKDWGDLLWWQLQENIPGEFPYTAGVFPLKGVS